MIRAGRWLEDTIGLDIQSLGRAALDRKDCFTLESSGRHLSYVIRLDGGWLSLSVGALDISEPPELLLRAADGPTGWTQATKLIAAFERAQIRSLQPRPIELGESGNPDSWVIA